MTRNTTGSGHITALLLEVWCGRVNQLFNISRLLSLVERSRLKTFADHEEHELRMNVIQIEHGAKYMYTVFRKKHPFCFLL